LPDKVFKNKDLRAKGPMHENRNHITRGGFPFFLIAKLKKKPLILRSLIKIIYNNTKKTQPYL